MARGNTRTRRQPSERDRQRDKMLVLMETLKNVVGMEQVIRKDHARAIKKLRAQADMLLVVHFGTRKQRRWARRELRGISHVIELINRV